MSIWKKLFGGSPEAVAPPPVTPPTPAQPIKIPFVALDTIKTIILVATNDQPSISGFRDGGASVAISAWAANNKNCWSLLKDRPQPPCSVYVEPNYAPDGRTGLALKFGESLINKLAREEGKVIRIFMQLGSVRQWPQGRSGPLSFCLLTVCEVPGLVNSEIVALGSDELTLA